MLALLGLLAFALWLRDETRGDLGVALCLVLASWEALGCSSHPVVQVAPLAAVATIVALLA